jgi:hypothetical protein
MIKTIYSYFILLLILAALGWAGTSDFEDARRVHGYYVAGVYGDR